MFACLCLSCHIQTTISAFTYWQKCAKNLTPPPFNRLTLIEITKQKKSFPFALFVFFNSFFLSTQPMRRNSTLFRYKIDQKNAKVVAKKKFANSNNSQNGNKKTKIIQREMAKLRQPDEKCRSKERGRKKRIEKLKSMDATVRFSQQQIFAGNYSTRWSRSEKREVFSLPLRQ